MSRKKNPYHEEIIVNLQLYATSRSLDLAQYSKWHYRITNDSYTILDIWSSAKYYIMETDYASYSGNHDTGERTGEKGKLPATEGKVLFDWLDKIFYATELMNS